VSRRRALGAAAAAALLALGPLGACGSEQDPGLEPSGTQGGPATTSHLLEACPAPGSGATIPLAGCLDEDGKVVHG
jgi:hypothetical protein